MGATKVVKRDAFGNWMQDEWRGSDMGGSEDFFRDNMCDQCEIRLWLWDDRLPKSNTND